MLNYLFKELKGQKRFVFLFTLNMSLGMLGLVLLLSFRTSFESSLEKNSKQLLTADMAITTRSQKTNTQQDIIRKNFDKQDLFSEQVQLFSMVRHQEKSQLIAIKAIDQHYPLHGELTLEQSGVVQQEQHQHMIQQQGVWLSQESALRLDAQINSQIHIGESTFQVLDIIKEDPSMDTTGGAFAPSLYLSQKHIEATGLLAKGSLAWYRTFIQTHQTIDLQNVKERLIDQLHDSSIRVQTHSDASERSGRLLGVLSDYLALVSMASIFLATIGSVCLYRSFLLQKLKQLAILVALGLPATQAAKNLILQLLGLAIGATFLSLGLASIFLPYISHIISDLLPIEFTLRMNATTFGITILCSLGMSFLAAAPLLWKIRDLNPTLLFQEHAMPNIPWHWKDIFYYLPGWIICYATSVSLSGSFFLGSLLSFGFIITGILVGGFCFFTLSLITQIATHQKSSTWSYTTKHLIRYFTPTATLHIAIGLSTFIITLIPSIRETINSQFSETTTQQSSLFLYDIQPYQVDTLKEMIPKEKILRLSPMVSSKLLTVNGKPFETKASRDGLSRQERINEESRNRSYNLSWRKDISTHETIIEGQPLKPWDENQSIIGLSIEERFAQRLQVKLGDTLTFEIEGESFLTRVENLRRVQWTSFEPNFFLLVQDGALEDLPSTWLAAILEPQQERKIALQNKIAQSTPNISVIDVKKLVEQILKLIQQMSFILTTMSFLTGLTAVLILFAIYIQRSYEQQLNLSRLIALGGQRSFITKTTIIEVLLTSFLPAVVGSLLAWPSSELLSQTVFYSSAIFSYKQAFQAIGIVTWIALFTRLWLLQSSLRRPPAQGLY